MLVLRGEGLDARVRETDPQAMGVPPLRPEALHPAAEHTSRILTRFVDQVGESIADEHPANFVLMRGYGQYRPLPSLESRFQIRAACLAVYPMYRGVARAVGMTVLPVTEEPGNQIAELERAWDDFDLFFLHIKETDTLGEDGDFHGKARAIEAVDRWLPRVRALNPDVLVVTATIRRRPRSGRIPGTRCRSSCGESLRGRTASRRSASPLLRRRAGPHSGALDPAAHAGAWATAREVWRLARAAQPGGTCRRSIASRAGSGAA